MTPVGYPETASGDELYKWREIKINNIGSALPDHQVPVHNLILNETDLIFSLHLNEESGQFARDHTQYPIHLNMVDTTCYEDSEMGWVREFNGVTSHGSETSDYSTHFSFTNQVTMSAWVYPLSRQTASDLDNIISRRQYLMLSPTGQVAAYLYGTSNPGYHYSNSTIPLNQWSHIAWTWTGATGTLTIYINGEVDRIVTGITGNTDNNTSWFRIGGVSPLENPSNRRSFHGRISHIKVYRRALSTSEIEILANKNRGYKLDYSNLDIVDSTGKPVPNWKEYDGKWWVKTSLPANSTVTLRARYGSQISSSYNGEEVFDFFDEFEGSEINTEKWNINDESGGIGSITVQNGILKAENTRLQLYRLLDTPGGKWILEGKVRNIDIPSQSYLRTRIRFTPSPDAGVFKDPGRANQIYVNGIWTTNLIPYGRWTTWRAIGSDFNTIYAWDDFYQSETVTHGSMFDHLTVAVGDTGGSTFRGHSEIDHIILRKYAPDNTVETLVGEEQSYRLQSGPHVTTHLFGIKLQNYGLIGFEFGLEVSPTARRQLLIFPKDIRHDTLGMRSVSFKKGDF